MTRRKGIFLNGRTASLKAILRDGDRIELLQDAPTPNSLQAESGALDIIYEDDNVIVLNKPAGLLVHPVGQTACGTVANLLVGLFAARGEASGVHPIHRLDRDTSGCVLFAKNPHAQHLCELQLKDGTLKRTYHAITSGIPPESVGLIDAPIGKHPTMPNRRIVTAKGDTAITHYRTLSTSAANAWLELELETGRTHQIRLHLAHIGCPVLGDKMYGRSSPKIPRQALHAIAITFTPPYADTAITVTAPLTNDMETLKNK